MTSEAPGFELVFVCDSAEFVAARWWNEAFQPARRLSRRQLHYVLAGAAVALPLLVVWLASEDGTTTKQVERSVDALELQRHEGWDVGYTNTRLVLRLTSSVDVAGGDAWRDVLSRLGELTLPSDPRLRPYAVQTLFQALTSSSSNSLVQALLPIHTSAMEQTHEASALLAEQISADEGANRSAVILDLPGPASVAAASVLAEKLTPVFMFDNWPHPRGVVPSHETLAAVLYYWPTFRDAARSRPEGAPPLFVLDSNRLNGYRDEAAQFDNRYIARIPHAGELAALGVRRVVYVRPEQAEHRELDDLNAMFVAYQNAAIELRFWSLGAQNSEPETYVARARDTRFSSRAFAAELGNSGSPVRPSDFGVVTVLTDPETGELARGSDRSGSFGRTRSWSSG